MTTKTSTVVSVTEAIQNFEKSKRLIDQFEPASDKDVMIASRRFMKQYRKAFEELAK